MEISRRGLITGLAGLVAAPAIVRASSLMPVKALTPGFPGSVTWVDQDYGAVWTDIVVRILPQRGSRMSMSFIWDNGAQALVPECIPIVS